MYQYNPNHAFYRLKHLSNKPERKTPTMAFWFGITSLVRPIALERSIPQTRVLALAEQRPRTSQQPSQLLYSPTELRTTPWRLKTLAHGVRGSDAGCNITLRDRERYRFLECSGRRGERLLLRTSVERLRDTGVYCITGTGYEWMAMGMEDDGRGCKWIRS